MRDKKLKQERTRHSGVAREPLPEYLTCPYCGSDIELWAETEVTRCFVCGHRFFRREATIH